AHGSLARICQAAAQGRYRDAEADTATRAGREAALTERTREEHLQWCKDRALEYLDEGNLASAIASMTSDLTKHPETAVIPSALTVVAVTYILNHDYAGARNWITGFR